MDLNEKNIIEVGRISKKEMKKFEVLGIEARDMIVIVRNSLNNNKNHIEKHFDFVSENPDYLDKIVDWIKNAKYGSRDFIHGDNHYNLLFEKEINHYFHISLLILDDIIVCSIRKQTIIKLDKKILDKG